MLYEYFVRHWKQMDAVKLLNKLRSSYLPTTEFYAGVFIHAMEEGGAGEGVMRAVAEGGLWGGAREKWGEYLVSEGRGGEAMITM